MSYVEKSSQKILFLFFRRKCLNYTYVRCQTIGGCHRGGFDSSMLIHTPRESHSKSKCDLVYKYSLWLIGITFDIQNLWSQKLRRGGKVILDDINLQLTLISKSKEIVSVRINIYHFIFLIWIFRIEQTRHIGWVLVLTNYIYFNNKINQSTCYINN